MADEAVLRIILEDGGTRSVPAPSRPAPAQSSSSAARPSVAPPQPPQFRPILQPPPTSIPPLAAHQRPVQPLIFTPADIRARDQFIDLLKNINLARQNIDVFGKTMAGVQGKLFELRHGIDPKSIADIFSKGATRAHDLFNELKQIQGLLNSGAITLKDRLELARGAVTNRPVQPATQAGTAANKPDWIRSLVDGIAGANRHVLIEGESGSGKSYLTRSIAFERAKQGEEVNVLDPHKPETWKGVSEVFTRETASDFSEKMLNTLREREAASVDARSRGESIDFKPVTFALSDFAAVAKEFPKLKDTIQTVLTEGRKFNIAVLAETAGFNAEEIGAGTVAMRRNFKQKVEMFAPGFDEPDRTAKMGGQTFKTPDLSAASDANKDKFDPSIVRYKSETQPEPLPPPPQFDPRAEAEKRREAERRRSQIDAAYKDQFGDDNQDTPLDKLLDVASQFRGVIGGFAGTLIGGTLDIVAAFRKAQIEVQEDRRKSQLLREVTDVSSSTLKPLTLPKPDPILPKPDPTIERPPASASIPIPAFASGTTDSGSATTALVHPGERIEDMTGGKRDVGTAPVLANLAPHSVILPKDLAEYTRSVPKDQEQEAIADAIAKLSKRKKGKNTQPSYATGTIDSGSTLQQAIVDPGERVENFKNWFGESKVVDNDNKPKTVYHGTTKQFDTFDPDKGLTVTDKIGSWFAADPSFADARLRHTNQGMFGGSSQGKLPTNSSIIPAHLSIKNPLKLSTRRELDDFLDKNIMMPEEIIKKYKSSIIKIWSDNADPDSPKAQSKLHDRITSFDQYSNNPAIRQLINNMAQGIAEYNDESEPFVEMSRSALRGYDGVYIADDQGHGEAWVSLTPQQIKSTTGNRGTYDPNNPDIRYTTGTIDTGNSISQAIVDPGERIEDMIGGKRDVGSKPVLANLAPHSIVLPKDLAEQTRNVSPDQEPVAIAKAVDELRRRKGVQIPRYATGTTNTGPGTAIVDPGERIVPRYGTGTINTGNTQSAIPSIDDDLEDWVGELDDNGNSVPISKKKAQTTRLSPYSMDQSIRKAIDELTEQTGIPFAKLASVDIMSRNALKYYADVDADAVFSRNDASVTLSDDTSRDKIKELVAHEFIHALDYAIGGGKEFASGIKKKSPIRAVVHAEKERLDTTDELGDQTGLYNDYRKRPEELLAWSAQRYLMGEEEWEGYDSEDMSDKDKISMEVFNKIDKFLRHSKKLIDKQDSSVNLPHEQVSIDTGRKTKLMPDYMRDRISEPDPRIAPDSTGEYIPSVAEMEPSKQSGISPSIAPKTGLSKSKKTQIGVGPDLNQPLMLDPLDALKPSKEDESSEEDDEKDAITSGLSKLAGTETISKMFDLGPATTVAVAGVVMLGKATVATVQLMDQSATNLSKYNAQLATSVAFAEARQIYGDVRRAQEAAPVLSRFVDAQSGLQQQTENLKIEFIKLIGPKIIELVESATIVVGVLNGIFKIANIISEYTSIIPAITVLLAPIDLIWRLLKSIFSTILGDTQANGEDPVRVIMNNLFDNANI